ncbi:MAG: hypothetical protein LBE09_03505, partial [Christensenellaceae bacterium]|nr:hypothetical protein [Christensenellaceae bacterium]
FAAQENQAHADENQIANTTVIMDDGTSVALPGKEVLPDKNPYQLKIELIAHMVNAEGTTVSTSYAIEQNARVSYSTNGGISFTLVELSGVTPDTDGWFTCYSVDNTNGIKGNGLELSKFLWGILINESYNDTTYTFYTDDGAIPTINITGTFSADTSPINFIYFLPEKKYYITGDIVVLNACDSETTGASLFNFYNEGFFKKKTDSGAETFLWSDSLESERASSDSQPPLQNIYHYPTSWQLQYALTGGAEGTPTIRSYTLYSDMQIGYGKDSDYLLHMPQYVSDRKEQNKNTLVLGGEAYQMVFAKSAVTLYGSAKLVVYSGAIGNYAENGYSQDSKISTITASAAVAENNPEFFILTAASEESLVLQNIAATNEIVIQDAGVVHDISKASVITGDKYRLLVTIHDGGVLTRNLSNGPVISTSDGENSYMRDSRIQVLGGTINNRWGTIINWYTDASAEPESLKKGANGYIIITAGTITIGISKEIEFPDKDKPQGAGIIANGDVKIIMTGGTITSIVDPDPVLNYEGRGTVSILGGTINHDVDETPTIQNGTDGTLNIGPNVTIVDSSSDEVGTVIKNAGTMVVDTRARIVGSIINENGSQDSYFVYIPNATKHMQLLVPNYSKYTTDTDKFFTDVALSNKYKLDFANDNAYAQIGIIFEVYTEENPQAVDSFSNAGYHTDKLIFASADGIYPSTSANPGTNELPVYSGFIAKYYIEGTNTEIFPGYALLDAYKTPHAVRCELHLEDTKLTYSGAFSDTNGTLACNYSVVDATPVSYKLEFSKSHQIIDSLTFSTRVAFAAIGSSTFTALNGPFDTVSSVNHSGVYRYTVESYITKYNITFSKVNEIYFDVSISPLEVIADKILLKLNADGFSEYTSADNLGSVITKGTAYTVDAKISTGEVPLTNSDYSISYLKNKFANNDGTDGIADVIITFSENFYIVSDGVPTRTVVRHFTIIPRRVVSLSVEFEDDATKNNYTSQYSAFESLSLDGIALVARYNDGSISQIVRDQYKILYLRTVTENSADWISEDGFNAVSHSQYGFAVKFVYEDVELIFGDTAGANNYPVLTVSKRDPGVSVVIADAVDPMIGEPLANYTINPHNVAGEWIFTPQSYFFDMGVSYEWTFTPLDTTNYTVASGSVSVANLTTPGSPSITIERSGSYNYTALQLFDLSSIRILASYQQSKYDSYQIDITATSDVYYYHGVYTGVSDILNDFYSWSGVSLTSSLNSCFYGGDTAFIIRYSYYNDLLYTSDYSVFTLSSPVAYISLDITPRIPDSVYTSTQLNSFIPEYVFSYGTIVWQELGDLASLTYPQLGYKQYSYTFTPKAQYVKSHASLSGSVHIDALPVTASNISITTLPTGLDFSAGDSLPNVSTLFENGLVLLITYSDSTTIVCDNNNYQSIGTFLLSLQSRSLDLTTGDFIGTDDHIVLNLTVDALTISKNIPVKVTLNAFEKIQLNPELPTSANLGQVPSVTYNPEKDYALTVSFNSDYAQNLSYSVYREVSEVDFFASEIYGITRSTAASLRYYLLYEGSNVKDAGAYSFLFVFSTDTKYFITPSEIEYDLLIEEKTLETFTVSLMAPSQSPVAQWSGNEYWLGAAVPQIRGINSENSAEIRYGTFTWLSPAGVVLSTLDFPSNANLDTITYHLVWSKPNYTSITIDVPLKVYTGQILRINASWSSSKTFIAGDIIDPDADGLIVQAEYQGNVYHTLLSSQYIVVYDNGNSSNDLDSELRGTHTKISIYLTFKVGTDTGFKFCTLAVSVNKKNYMQATFADQQLPQPGSPYWVTANSVDPKLYVSYWTWADSTAPGDLNANDEYSTYVLIDGSDGIASDFYGYYVPFEPLVSLGTHKVLAHFTPRDESYKLDYNAPHDMVATITLQRQTFVEEPNPPSEGAPYFYGFFEVQYNATSDLGFDGTSDNRLSNYLKAYYLDGEMKADLAGTFSFVKEFFDIASTFTSHSSEYLVFDDVEYDYVFVPNDSSFSTYYGKIKLAISPWVTQESTTTLYDSQDPPTAVVGQTLADYISALVAKGDFTLSLGWPQFAQEATHLPSSLIAFYSYSEYYSAYFHELNLTQALLDQNLFDFATENSGIILTEGENVVVKFEFLFNGFRLPCSIVIPQVIKKTIPATYQVSVPGAQSKDYDSADLVPEITIDGSSIYGLSGFSLQYSQKADSEWTDTLKTLFNDNISAVGEYVFFVKISRQYLADYITQITYKIESFVTFDWSGVISDALYYKADSGITSVKIEAPAAGTSTEWTNDFFSALNPQHYKMAGWSYTFTDEYGNRHTEMIFDENGKICSGTSLLPNNTWYDMSSITLYVTGEYKVYKVSYGGAKGRTSSLGGSKSPAAIDYGKSLTLNGEKGDWTGTADISSSQKEVNLIYCEILSWSTENVSINQNANNTYAVGTQLPITKDTQLYVAEVGLIKYEIVFQLDQN